MVGLLVAGLGGRVVMRLAAILVPDAVGAFTENGNRIGDITLSGSLGLILAGLFLGPFAGVVWVVVSPWIPGRGLARAILTVPIAVALGTLALIRADNRDFRILDHDPAVVAALLGLVAVVGLSIALVDDGWIGGMPQAAPAPSRATSVYAVLTSVGAILIFPFVFMSYFVAGAAPRRPGPPGHGVFNARGLGPSSPRSGRPPEAPDDRRTNGAWSRRRPGLRSGRARGVRRAGGMT